MATFPSAVGGTARAGCGDAPAVVVIGRNEGERLRVCLASVCARGCSVVYVDSGSDDGSVALARGFGVEIVHLDMGRPFTAARARNAGFQSLAAREPGVEFVQFIDGDCELLDGWFEAGVPFLRAHPTHAVVAGRTHERHPERSIFNRLCDWEWDAPPGEARHCGGNALVRASAFAAAGGYRESLIAGEEPELCVRLARAGWKIHRLRADMVLHDAAMTRLAQWWARTLRGGHAFAEGAWLHGTGPERHYVRETIRAVVYGGAIPLAALAGAVAFGPWALALLAIYPLQVARLALRLGNWPRAFFLVLGRFPECCGVLKFHARRLRGGERLLIEYK